MTKKQPPRDRPYRLITDNDQLHENLASLGATDVFIGRLRLRPGEENLVTYLVERGVTLYPSGLSQLCSRSKAMQARVFPEFMLPDTRVIGDLHELLGAMGDYGRAGHGPVVTKADRANGGLGINLWTSVEDVFNQASLKAMEMPFVLQPFIPNSRDMRVIILGDYLEAYWRDNPDNFRNNLHCGGHHSHADISETQVELCRQVMEKGCFPYAHLDLMVTESGETWLAEINLRGGIRGADISPAEYLQRIDRLHQCRREELGL